jgi:hypothetical protein
LHRMLAVRDFAMLRNNAEYKKMGQELSLGQLYDVHNEIKISIKHSLVDYDKGNLTCVVRTPLSYAGKIHSKAGRIRIWQGSLHLA